MIPAILARNKGDFGARIPFAHRSAKLLEIGGTNFSLYLASNACHQDFRKGAHKGKMLDGLSGFGNTASPETILPRIAFRLRCRRLFLM